MNKIFIHRPFAAPSVMHALKDIRITASHVLLKPHAAFSVRMDYWNIAACKQRRALDRAIALSKEQFICCLCLLRKLSTCLARNKQQPAVRPPHLTAADIIPALRIDELLGRIAAPYHAFFHAADALPVLLIVLLPFR
jgi:hypothetical protein